MDALAGAVVAVLIARRMWLSWCVRERNGYINLQKRDCGTPKFAPQPYWRRFNRQSVLLLLHAAKNGRVNPWRSGADNGRGRWSCVSPNTTTELASSTPSLSPAATSTNALQESARVDDSQSGLINCR